LNEILKISTAAGHEQRL